MASTIATAAHADSAIREFNWTVERIRIDTTIPRMVAEKAIGYLTPRVLAEQDFAARIAAANHAEKTLAAFGRLAPHHRWALGESDRLNRQGHLSPAVIREQTSAAEAAAWAADPLLADLHAAMEIVEDTRRAAVDAEQRAARARDEADLPGILVARLRQRGVTLGLDTKGHNVTVLQGDQLTPDDKVMLGQHKACIISLLRAEIDAARPIVVV